MSQPPSSARRSPGQPRPGQPRPGQIALALAVALLGFLLATQFRARESLVGRLKTEREADLTQLLADLQKQSDDLIEEVVSLRVQLSNTTSSQSQEKTLVENAARQLRDIRLLLGLAPAKGEGIEIVIGDTQKTIGADLLVDTVQELRDAGAEAIEVNNVRVVAQTSFSGSPGSLRIDRTTKLTPPFIIKAIGARSTLAEAMRIPGGVVDVVQARPGASIGVSEKPKLTILSLHPAPRFSYATRT